MSFAAYRRRFDEPDFTWVGSRVPSDEPPVATAETLEELQREALAYLVNEPDAYLFLADSEGNVRAVMSGEKPRQAGGPSGLWICHSLTFLFFGLTCLFAAWVSSLETMALLSFFGAVALYFLMLRMDFQTEFDSAVTCEIALILVLLLIPAIQQLRDRANERRNRLPPQSAATTWICRNTSAPLP